MVCGLSAGGCYVVCLGALESGCVFSDWVGLSMYFSLARTNLF